MMVVAGDACTETGVGGMERVAVLGSDGVSDAIPSGTAKGWPMPIHQCGIVAIGLPEVQVLP